MTKLDRTWKNCLRMWKWISENLPERFDERFDNKKSAVVELLKSQWLRQNGFTKHLEEDCFFCEYDMRNGDVDADACDNCPMKIINRQSGCCAKKYHYRKQPKAFYEKLLELDAKRKGQK